MPPEKSRSLHNFSLPPLTWGSQRFLRCSYDEKPSAAVDGDIRYTRRPRPHPSHDASRDPVLRSVNSSIESGVGDRIEVIREKRMIEIQSEVDKINNAIMVEGGDGDPLEDPRPWNLRTRRAACQESVANCCGDEAKHQFSSRRKKFSITLSRREVEEDFLEISRRRPARKPKKRPKHIQKELDMLFPGYWLSEITADMYKVDQTPEGQ